MSGSAAVSRAERIRRFFNRRHLGLGWSVLWRLFLLMLPVRVLGELFALRQASQGPAAGLGAAGALFALPVGGNLYLFPLALPVLLIGLDWIGKHVARRRLEREVGGFLGWSIYWRWALLQLAGLATLAAFLSPLVLVATRTGGPGRGAAIVAGAAALVLLPALVVWGVNAAGWSLLRAVDRAPVAASAVAVPDADAGPVREWTRLFDRERFGFNWSVAGAWALPALLLPWVAATLRALVGDAFHPPEPAWYAVFVALSLAEGAAFAELSHRLRNGWLLAPAMAVVALLAALVEAATSGGLGPWFLLSATLRNLLAVAGLVAGVRLLGARFGGLFAGLGAGLLLWGFAVYPFAVAASLSAGAGGTPPEFYREVYLFQAILRPLEAALLSGLLLAAVRRHLRRRGLWLAGGALTAAARSGTPTGG